ncbi:TPA: transcriptional regulator [Serratia fonticola]
MVNVKAPEISQTLNEPCARCLEILLDNHGQIVSHDALYQVAWPDAYKTTSPNTLYQNILLARKAFKEVSDSNEEFILTIPRKGFSFNEEIPVTVQEENSTIAEPLNQSEETSVVIVRKTDLSDKILSMRNVFNKYFRTLIFAILLLSSFLFFQSFYQYNQFTSNDFARDYGFYQSSGECRLHVHNHSAELKKVLDSTTKIMPKLTAECHVFPEVYITWFNNPKRIFFLSCNKTDKVGRKCKTGYLRL